MVGLVTVYTKPGCSQCYGTKLRLDKLGVVYSMVDVTKDDAAYDLLVSRGFQEMPIVDPGDGSSWWSGFRADRLKRLAA